MFFFKNYKKYFLFSLITMMLLMLFSVPILAYCSIASLVYKDAFVLFKYDQFFIKKPFFLFLLFNIGEFIILIIPVLFAVAFLTLLERKILGSVQRRRGPGVVGIFGFLQPFADGMKLFFKESIVPAQSNKVTFLAAPMISLSLSFMGWAVVPVFPYNYVYSQFDLALLYLFAISSLSVYGVIVAGWSSNSKYSFLGSLRSAAQMVSYEVSIGLILISIILCVKSLKLEDVVLFQMRYNTWFILPFFPVFLMFFISSLVETNRPPFDLPEAEAELVSGYNVEYSGVGFAFFFIAEYANILLMSFLSVIFFFGGWLPFYTGNYFVFFFGNIPHYFWFFFKFLIILYLFILVRATLPRYRYDQLMKLGWKYFLPFSLSWVILVSIVLFII